MEKSNTPTKENTVIPCVIFRLGINLFSIPISQLREIAQSEEILAMPGGPETVRGLIELRGHYLPVVDLHKKLHGRANPPPEQADNSNEQPTDHDLNENVQPKILVADLRLTEGRFTIGLQVDEVIEVHYLPIETVEPAPAITHQQSTKCVAGLFKHKHGVVRLLDCRRMFTPDELGGNLEA